MNENMSLEVLKREIEKALETEKECLQVWTKAEGVQLYIQGLEKEFRLHELKRIAEIINEIFKKFNIEGD